MWTAFQSFILRDNNNNNNNNNNGNNKNNNNNTTSTTTTTNNNNNDNDSDNNNNDMFGVADNTTDLGSSSITMLKTNLHADNQQLGLVSIKGTPFSQFFLLLP